LPFIRVYYFHSTPSRVVRTNFDIYVFHYFIFKQSLIILLWYCITFNVWHKVNCLTTPLAVQGCKAIYETIKPFTLKYIFVVSLASEWYVLHKSWWTWQKLSCLSSYLFPHQWKKYLNTLPYTKILFPIMQLIHNVLGKPCKWTVHQFLISCMTNETK
jgi:hypothetical protein